MTKDKDSAKHELMKRSNSKSNPIIFDTATILRQPNGIPFKAQAVSNINQAKILVKIIQKLQEPIRQTIESDFYRKNPTQLALFKEEIESSIQLDFELSEFGVDSTNYRKLKADFISMQSLVITKDTVYFNKLANSKLEAEETMPLIARVILPKAYERYISIKIEKEVALHLVNVGNNGYTKYLLEIAMESVSKYTLLIYQLISSWQDKGGFSWTIKTFKEYLNIQDKYDSWKNLNARVIRPAYEELYEKANIWFEYDVEKKDDKPYKINFKVIKGYYKILDAPLESLFKDDENIERKIIYSALSKKGQEAIDILQDTLLITDENVIGEIVTYKLDDFYKWYNQNKANLATLDKPSSMLLHYLKLTAKFDWKPQKWVLIKSIYNNALEYVEIWNNICNTLTVILGRQVVKKWFKPITISVIKETKEIRLNVPSSQYIEMIEKEYIKNLKEAIVQELGEQYKLYYDYHVATN